MLRISTEDAPRAIGPYSQAIVSGGLVFCSGQIAIDPADNEFKPATVEQETNMAITNIKAVLKAAGTDLNKVVKVTVYLSKMEDFPLMNAIYEKYFKNNPARSTVAVSGLPKGAKVEIEAIAVL